MKDELFQIETNYPLPVSLCCVYVYACVYVETVYLYMEG